MALSFCDLENIEVPDGCLGDILCLHLSEAQGRLTRVLQAEFSDLEADLGRMVASHQRRLESTKAEKADDGAPPCDHCNLTVPSERCSLVPCDSSFEVEPSAVRDGGAELEKADAKPNADENVAEVLQKSPSVNNDIADFAWRQATVPLGASFVLLLDMDHY